MDVEKSIFIDKKKRRNKEKKERKIRGEIKRFFGENAGKFQM